MATLNKISIGGFRNIDYIEIDLQNLTTLLAPNNYGKSNVLDAIKFGSSFMHVTSDEKAEMMHSANSIPINSSNAGKPYRFEMEGVLENGLAFLYSFSFRWLMNGSQVNGETKGKILSEYLGIKDYEAEKPKYRGVFVRKEEEAKYDSCGRCNKLIAVSSDELVINKLSNLDSWNYRAVVIEILSIKIRFLNSLSDPVAFFIPGFSFSQKGKLEFSIDRGFPEYLFYLQEKEPELFEFLTSTIIELVPVVESIKPIRQHFSEKQVVDGIPFELPDSFDVLVKEKYNNQATPFRYLSTGSMKVLFLLANCIRANEEGVQLLLVEELENSIHPRLMENLLQSISSLIGETKLIFTSHSTHLAQHLTAGQLYVGIPSDKGLVDFRTLKPSKVKNVLKIAAAGNMSLGEYLFDLMLDLDGDPELIDDFFKPISQKKGVANDN